MRRALIAAPARVGRVDRDARKRRAPDHPHLRDGHAHGRRGAPEHAHAFVIDDLHPHWPEPARAGSGMVHLTEFAGLFTVAFLAATLLPARPRSRYQPRSCILEGAETSLFMDRPPRTLRLARIVALAMVLGC